MKQYQSPLFLARLLRYRYSHRHISQQNVISLCQGGTVVDVALMPKFVYAVHYLGSRHYSNGFHALNRVPTSFDDVRYNGRSGAEYRKNVNHIQQWSGTENPNLVNEGTNSEYLRHDNYAEKAIQQNPAYSGSRNAMVSQQVTCQQYPSNPLRVNAVGHESHGYRQENTRVQPSLNACHPLDQMGAYQQQLTDAYGRNSGQNVEGVDDPLKELDSFCKEWDLVNAVTCMKDFSLRGVGIDLPRYFTLRSRSLWGGKSFSRRKSCP